MPTYCLKSLELNRVEKELDEFPWSLDFFPRVGGGIGITRLLHAMNDYSCKTNSC